MFASTSDCGAKEEPKVVYKKRKESENAFEAWQRLPLGILFADRHDPGQENVSVNCSVFEQARTRDRQVGVMREGARNSSVWLREEDGENLRRSVVYILKGDEW